MFLEKSLLIYSYDNCTLCRRPLSTPSLNLEVDRGVHVYWNNKGHLHSILFPLPESTESVDSIVGKRGFRRE